MAGSGVSALAGRARRVWTLRALQKAVDAPPGRRAFRSESLHRTYKFKHVLALSYPALALCQVHHTFYQQQCTSLQQFLCLSVCVLSWFILQALEASSRSLHHMQPRISTRHLQSGASRTGNQAVLTGGTVATALAGSAASARGPRGILLPLLATLWWWTQVCHNALVEVSMLGYCRSIQVWAQ